jgi:hypothetical protein
MYVRSKKWNGKTYYQLILSAWDRNKLAERNAVTHRDDYLPGVITLPRQIFLSTDYSMGNEERYPAGSVVLEYSGTRKRLPTGAEQGDPLPNGKTSDETTTTYSDQVFIEPNDEHGRYVGACIEAAMQYYRDRSKEKMLTKRHKVNERAIRRVCKAEWKLKQLYLCWDIHDVKQMEEILAGAEQRRQRTRRIDRR